MSVSHKKRGGNLLRDKNGRFRKKGSKKQLIRKNSMPKKKAPKRQTPKKQTPKKKQTLILNTPNETKTTKSPPIAYGHVFSTSCGHCNDMQPAWDELKQDIGSDIELCDIANDHSDQVRQFNDRFHSTLNIDGFPTVFKLAQQGKPVEYYDSYYKKQQDEFDQGITSIKPAPFRSKESMKIWVLGG